MAINKAPTPAIPSIPAGIDAQTSLLLSAIKEIIEVREGRRGRATERFVSFRELSEAMARIRSGLSTYRDVVGSFSDGVISTPTAFTVTKGHWANHLFWSNPANDDLMYAATEIWVSSSNNRSTATLLAVVTYPSDTYVHFISDYAQDHYYWIRGRSHSPDVYSTWVPIDAMGGELVPGDETVGETIGRLMDILKGTDPPTYNPAETYYLHDIVMFAGMDGSFRRYRCIDDNTGSGVSGVDPTDQNTWERIGILLTGEVDGIPMVALDGNLVADGTILARAIAAGIITGDHINAASTIVLGAGGSLTMGEGSTLVVQGGGSLEVIGSLSIVGGATGISNFADAGLLASKDAAGVNELTSDVLQRLFVSEEARASIEAWRMAGSPTHIDGSYIYAKTITADHFMSTLYGDLNQALNYVKTVMGANDEYTHELTLSDLESGDSENIMARWVPDYGLSLRLSTVHRWDEEERTWDEEGYTWDIPIEVSGIWVSDVVDMGEKKGIQLGLRFSMEEDSPGIMGVDFKSTYSIDNVSWGANHPDYDDDSWDTMNIAEAATGVFIARSPLHSFRYFKIKVELSTNDASSRAFVHSLMFLGNVIRLFGSHVNYPIGSGGETIPLSGFSTTPAITVTPVGATTLIPNITAQSKDSVTIHLMNLSNSSVGGYANITIIGE